MEKIQLSNAHRTKMPSERQMTHALQATRLGGAEFRFASAAQWMARVPTHASGYQGRDAQQLQQDEGEGTRRNVGSRRFSTALRPSPDAMAQTTASNGPSHRATRSTPGLTAAAASASC